MRCPKCGYISFDRQKSCGKCSNDLTAVAEQLQGTLSKVAPPFFLGAALGKPEAYAAAPGPALQEEEEPLELDELAVDGLPADEDGLDFAGAPLNEDDLEDQPLPSFSFEDIDVSDLVPPQEEEEEKPPVMSLEDGEEETLLAPIPSDDDNALTGIEFPGFDSDEALNVAEQESPLDDLEFGVAEPQANAEDEEIIDLSSLMNFDETPAKPESQEDHDIFDLSLGDAPDGFLLSIEDDENAHPPAEDPKKSASTVVDIADLGLTLENDDQ